MKVLLKTALAGSVFLVAVCGGMAAGSETSGDVGVDTITQCGNYNMSPCICSPGYQVVIRYHVTNPPVNLFWGPSPQSMLYPWLSASTAGYYYKYTGTSGPAYAKMVAYMRPWEDPGSYYMYCNSAWAPPTD